MRGTQNEPTSETVEHVHNLHQMPRAVPDAVPSDEARAQRDVAEPAAVLTVQGEEESLTLRMCPARGCDKPIKRRHRETKYNYERRITCNAPECISSIREDGKAAQKLLALLKAQEGTHSRVADELMPWHRAAQKCAPVGPARWWR